MEKKFVPAREAYRKLKFASDLNNPVYIFGTTGYGKTTLVSQFLKGKSCLKLDGGELNESNTLTKLLADGKRDISRTLVIDNLQLLYENERKMEIVQLIRRKSCWVILIGRIQPPAWLMPLYAECSLTVISENDLKLSSYEVGKMAENRNVQLTKQQKELISCYGHGNVFVIQAFLAKLQEGFPMTDDLIAETREYFEQYLDSQIISKWSLQLQDFLMKISVVDSFDLTLAETITGDDKALAMLERALEVGNFLKKEGDIYYLHPELCPALRKKAVKELGSRVVNQCKYNAGLYYEMHDRVQDALKMYESIGDNDRIRALLIRNARRNPSAGHFYDLKKYYLSLTEDEVRSSVVLMSALSLLYAVLLDIEKSEYWYDELKNYAQSAKGTVRQEADATLFYLDVALPHRDSVRAPELIKHVYPMLIGKGFLFPDFSPTNNQPSLMNGGKDFCEWSKKDVLLAQTIGKLVERMMGSNGRGAVACALGESFFEKGKDNTETLSYLNRAQIECDGSGSLEMMFIPVGFQVRMSILVGNLQNAGILLDGFEQRVLNEKAEGLLPNIRALRCRLALYAGDYETVDRWLEEAPNENIEFCTLERYRYLTKVRCYLSRGQLQEAILLIDRLHYFADLTRRNYISMETDFLRAIAEYRQQGNWQEYMLRGLKKAEEYQFVRIISEFGAAILPLLKSMKKTYLGTEGANEKWFAQTIEETERVASRYGSYLNTGTVSRADFSASAISILKMQSEGMSIKDIAERLGVSERTVKYHAAENYRKLGAKGKTDAVQKAVERRII